MHAGALLYYKVCFPETEFLGLPDSDPEISQGQLFLDGQKIDVVLKEMEK